MTEQQYEALSCLMDGELAASQAETVLDALCRDEAVAAEWHRMHQIRALLHGNTIPILDVSAAVREALANEPAYLLPGVSASQPISRWPRYALGSALAASVALATVIGLRQWQPSPAPPELANTAPGVAIPAVAVAQTPETTLASTTTQEATPPRRPTSQLETYRAIHAARALFADPEPFTSPMLYPVLDTPIDAER